MQADFKKENAERLAAAGNRCLGQKFRGKTKFKTIYPEWAQRVYSLKVGWVLLPSFIVDKGQTDAL